MTSDAATATSTTRTTPPPEGPAPDQEPPALGLGTSLPPADARAKTEGTFPYAADLWAEGLLWAAVLRSPHPHARILSIDTDGRRGDARGACRRHARGHPRGRLRTAAGSSTAPSSPPTLVRHHGEAIAAVAADHPDTARLAAAAIAVEYEVLEPVTDPEKAFAAEPLHPDGNLIRHIPLRYGDPDTVGEVIVEGLYRIGRQDPAPIGAEAGLAVPRPDGGVELYTASTDPHTDRDLAAACFGLEPERVKVVVTGVPGATGDREDPGFQIPLGLLALRTGCPVKLAATREESFLGHAHRHPTLLRYRHHADAEGRLVKVEAQILLDAGAYADASVRVPRRRRGLRRAARTSSRTPSSRAGRSVRTTRRPGMCAARARCRSAPRTRARWTSWPRSWASTRSNCACATPCPPATSCPPARP